jgi:hypothetical protein
MAELKSRIVNIPEPIVIEFPEETHATVFGHFYYKADGQDPNDPGDHSTCGIYISVPNGPRGEVRWFLTEKNALDLANNILEAITRTIDIMRKVDRGGI